MLEELQIRNLGPIHEALMTPASGMTAITGETGAGKSMLLSAIRMISGDSADAGRVSSNEPEAWAQGVFVVGVEGEAANIAREAGIDIDTDEGELFLARTVPAAGRSRAVLSGRGVPRTVLQRIARELVTVHGQADQLRIASAARQREFLDMVAGDDGELAAYREAWDALQAMDERLGRLESQEATARSRADYLRESIAEIERIDPQLGEDDNLKSRRSRIEHAAEIAQGVGAALAALDSSQVDADAQTAGALELVNRAAQSLRAIHVSAGFDESVERLESISADISDVVFSLSNVVDTPEEGEDLDAINDRIHELAELTRRWGPTLADVIEWRNKAEFELEDLDASPEKVSTLQAERQRLFDRAVAAADDLSVIRTSAAGELGSKVTKELASLAMAGANLEIHVSGRDQLDAHGRDDIEFLFAPFPGSALLSMGKSASGGELSRLMLALELVAAGRRSSHSDVTGDMTFIFDEVDAGVGGKAAAELGRRLARLAQSSQVIVVTHLAQVATWADEQFVVSKGSSADSDSPVSAVVGQVMGESRVHEIARMLSGSESETSLDHARELLESSRL